VEPEVLKSLLVNLCADRQDEVEDLVIAIEKFSECASVKFREIDAIYTVDKDIDAVILSGSRARIVDEQQRNEFKHVSDLIKRLNLPLLGICYGHQLLCTTFGCEVEALAEPIIDRFEKVHIIKDDAIFSGFKTDQTGPVFFESHNDKVKKNNLNKAGFVLLADSYTCDVEAVRHKTKPFYGVQFHPERTKIESETHPEGHKLIENFYKNVVKKKS
jgi:GMP synthase (glutamine-hydrolysing)